MLAIHPNARTTPAVRAEIARSAEPTGELARRYGVSTEDRPRVARARARGLPRPFRASSQAAVEGERGGAGGGLRPAPGDRPPARRPHLRGPALPAAPGPRQRLPHPQGRGPEPPAGPDQAREARGQVQGVRARLRPRGREAPAQAADRGRRVPQALPVRGHRPPLALGPPGGQGRRDRGQRQGLPGGGARGLPVPGHAPADRPRPLLHGRRLREALPRARRRAPQDQALHAAHERDGRALQRARAARGARDHHRRPPRSGAAARRLRPSLQRPPPARAGRELARGDRPRASAAGAGPRQPRLPPAVRSVRPPERDARDRACQGRLAARQLGRCHQTYATRARPARKFARTALAAGATWWGYTEYKHLKTIRWLMHASESANSNIEERLIENKDFQFMLALLTMAI